MSEPGVRRIMLLTLGWEDLPKSVSVDGAPADERLCRTGAGRPAPVRRRLAAARHRFQPGPDPGPGPATAVPRRPCLPAILPGPGEPLEEALEQAGVRMDEIAAVARQPPAQRPRRRPAAFRRPGPGARPAGRARLRAGAATRAGAPRHLPDRLRRPGHRLAPGRRRRRDRPRVSRPCSPPATPRATRASWSTSTTSVGGGGFVFAFDAADLTENIEDELAVGGFIGVPARGRPSSRSAGSRPSPQRAATTSCPATTPWSGPASRRSWPNASAQELSRQDAERQEPGRPGS